MPPLVLVAAIASVALLVASTGSSAAGPDYGSIAITGAVRATLAIAGSCTANTGVADTVTLHTATENGATLDVAGTGAVPSGPINLATTTGFNVELEIATGPGAGGSWLAGYAATSPRGSGTLTMTRDGESGSIDAMLLPYGGGVVDKPIELTATWNCRGAGASVTTTTELASATHTAPVAILMSHVPSTYFGCETNSDLNLGGESTVFRYQAIAEVDCEVEGVAGVSVLIYLLYPNVASMKEAFRHVFINEVARPRAGLGCSKTFDSDACNYRIGRSTTSAGEYVRFLRDYSSDPNPTPSIAWTSNRYGIITYLAGAESNDTNEVERYWATGDPNPV